jgi:hypothetical protein
MMYATHGGMLFQDCEFRNIKFNDELDYYCTLLKM